MRLLEKLADQDESGAEGEREVLRRIVCVKLKDHIHIAGELNG